ncbi:hypothetical protein XAC3810_320144 [Xanthomonas citri pv. citri]|uniref:Uncharacterized protein n=1 Tax=Xanthomonas citri pv. citri TaxID=611301 RepID=A0A0U5BT43_XANCI|nr:hypothetical protein XAC9322_340136 [Xanthomonas citri pv. citri]CEE25538.1 hypothetical protein XAC3824_390003 [Xanthomonas citri pv. citri]CEE27094.1 hypothetical protein XAC1083_360124 [Xanthomonas citri pv. citri]CEE35715.1 hypothetical protein XAC3810_320144 [Xanthomonas citri pv. citri]CEE38201.1 hypothetical protein XAC902_480139 [Xanthomonas citri pv. citri]
MAHCPKRASRAALRAEQQHGRTCQPAQVPPPGAARMPSLTPPHPATDALFWVYGQRLAESPFARYQRRRAGCY